ncbi:uncharacterized protein LOC129871465 [Solanum dulcamara]|uniref:uncharacterized protein LOC129871465 n=1 Tax=Solanum dulcamara TaxID=45834 RepID=UPI00248690A9|nr:uncharacterized protein LOC129871465 [Solanum dulcamara]
MTGNINITLDRDKELVDPLSEPGRFFRRKKRTAASQNLIHKLNLAENHDLKGEVFQRSSLQPWQPGYCPHHYQANEVLVHTFIEELEPNTKILLDSAAGGQALEKTYDELYILLHHISQGNPEWNGGNARSVTQKQVGMLEVDAVTALTAQIAAMQNMMTTHFNMLVKEQQQASVSMVQQQHMWCEVQINLPLIDLLQGIPKYAKFVKDIVANKSKLAEFATVALTEDCSSRILNKSKLPVKLKDLGSFTVQVTIGKYSNARARPDGIIEDVLVQVGSLIFPVDFVILDFESDPDVPFILGRLFLATGGALIDMAAGRLTMRAHDKVEVFDVYHALKLPAIYEELSDVTIIDKEISAQCTTSNDPLAKVVTSQDIKEDMEAKELASVLDMPNISMWKRNVIAALEVLKRHKKAIGWQIVDLHGISLALCMYRIFIEEGHKASAQPQRQLNPIMKEVVKKGIIKWLDVGIIYPISDSKWRCMIAIFHDMVEEFVEVFMDDFSVFGESFDLCLKNLEKVLARCEETNLVLNWELPFVLMCDTSDTAANYTVTEKEMLALVYAFDKFHSYLVGTKVIVFTDHAALRYLFNKKDAKSRLIRWILLLEEFDIEIKDRRGCENQIENHLLRLEGSPHVSEQETIKKEFPDEKMMEIEVQDLPWYADIVNYLVSGVIPPDATSQQKKKLIHDARLYIWDEPYLFK